MKELIKKILIEEYSPAGKEITPNSIVVHKSNPMFRDKILEQGLKARAGECYRIYAGYGVKCKPAIFATNSTNKRAWFDSTYDDDIWFIDTRMIPDVKWYKDRHFESTKKHIVTFQDIPKEAITLKYEGTGSGDVKKWDKDSPNIVRESIKKILREEITEDKNLYGEKLKPCSTKPMTGFYRDGYCRTGDDDTGSHTVCARVTEEFLEFTKSMGNNLDMLEPGDKWCLCAKRWEEANKEGVAPEMIKSSTNIKTLDIINGVEQELDEYARTLKNARKQGTKLRFPKSAIKANPQRFRKYTRDTIQESDPKTGTGKKPEGSSRRLYTDENPNDTVSVKFRTKQDIIDTLNKSSFKSKPHKRQSQIINLIHQRVRAAYQNAKNPETKKRLKTAYDYIETVKEKSKQKTIRLQKQKVNESKTPNYNELIYNILEPFKNEYAVCEINVLYDEEDDMYSVYLVLGTEELNNKFYYVDVIKTYRDKLVRKIKTEIKSYLPIDNLYVGSYDKPNCEWSPLNESKQNSKKDLLLKVLNNLILPQYEHIICGFELKNVDDESLNSVINYPGVIVKMIGGYGTRMLPQTQAVQKMYDDLLDEIWDTVWDYTGISLELYSNYVKECNN